MSPDSEPGRETVQPGSVLGPYEIVELLGAGGMGAVYRARDTRLDREVALKIILPDTTSESTHRRRFLNEARAVSALNHPNVVTVYEAASIEGVDFIAMELIVGDTLSVRIGRGAIPIPDAVRLALQVAEGLSAAHHAGLVHRDLKPSNIMITLDGRVKILDFGLAKKTERSEATMVTATLSMLTAAGTAVGTLAYMSPEQARGDVPGPLSDMFTYGTIVYEALTGLRPFDAKTQLDYFHQLCFEDPVPLTSRRPDTPAALLAIVTRAMARNPAERFASMASLVDALKILVLSDAQLAFASSTATMTTLPRYSTGEFSPRAKTWRRTAQAGLITIATFAVATAVYFVVKHPSVTPAPPATLTRMTYDAGFTSYPAISADGKLLAYASDRAGGNLDIWVQQLGGGEPTRLTKDTDDDYEPAFSPDGTHIAYRSDRRGGGVYVTPTLSGTEELLASGGFDPKYSPDGGTLAYWRGYVGGALYPKAAQIVLLPLRTRQPRIFRPDFETAAYPVWLSNSRLLFLGRKRDKNGNAVIDWWVADIDTGYAVATGALKRFADAGLDSVPSTYWFKPETEAGGDIFFTATHGDATNIWKIPVDGDGVASGPPSGVTFGASLDSSVSVADQGSGVTVAFSSLSLARNVWKQPLADNGLASVAAQKLLSDEADMSSPTVSIDGRLLALLARETDGYRILTFNLSNMQRNSIAAVSASRGGLNDPRFPLLSGDGKKLVFRRDHMAFITTVQDGPVTQVIASCGKPSSVSFDGGEVICDSRDPSEKMVLWSHGTTGTVVSQPDVRGTTQFDGNFSPNEKFVAYSEGHQGSAERRIMVVPNAPNRKLNADEWIAISDSGDFDISPVWGADGKHIYWVSDKDGFRCIWTRPVDPVTAQPTGPAIPLAHFHAASQTLRLTSLSASRNSLIFTMTETTGNIWTQQVEGAGK